MTQQLRNLIEFLDRRYGLAVRQYAIQSASQVVPFLRSQPWVTAQVARRIFNCENRDELIISTIGEWMMSGDWDTAHAAVVLRLRQDYDPNYADNKTGGLHSFDVADATTHSITVDDEVVARVQVIIEMLTPRQFEVVTTVADTGSQSEAAELLGISRQRVHTIITEIRSKVEGS